MRDWFAYSAISVTRDTRLALRTSKTARLTAAFSPSRLLPIAASSTRRFHPDNPSFSCRILSPAASFRIVRFLTSPRFPSACNLCRVSSKLDVQLEAAAECAENVGSLYLETSGPHQLSVRLACVYEFVECPSLYPSRAVHLRKRDVPRTLTVASASLASDFRNWTRMTRNTNICTRALRFCRTRCTFSRSPFRPTVS